ncbi:MAG: T9SS type A sorting domain-containing protein [Bacteroidetes bacterium]|nr:MAG: T9SS type A sorting domain-containing protein [Bacteroidota bacterium]
MKSLIIYFFLFMLSPINLFGQIAASIFSDKSLAYNLYPQFSKVLTEAPEIKMPSFDVTELLKEDELLKNLDIPFRFGKGFDVNYSLADGLWTKNENNSVWLMRVTSLGAYSINFIFKELVLPEGSELFIFSYDGSMVYGPITSTQNLIDKNIFFTDVIKGESVILYLQVPFGKEADAKLGISKIIHGYRDSFASLFGVKTKSGYCEQDVACYSSWNNESDGVAKILIGGLAWCTGSLLNNSAQDFKAYILTAFHCVDTDENGTISPTEQSNSANWVFTFHYKNTTCNGGQIANTISYNYDNLRASWYTSDVALLELQSSPLYNMCLTFLGWDRRANVPSSTTCIHHPLGDVMKISFDTDQPLKTERWQNTSGSNFWKVIWNIGVTEPKSSGSPLFDQNKRVVGQLLGGYSQCGGSDLRDWYGAFDVSWANVLSTYLGLSQYVNTIRYGQITGPELVCNSNSTFTLQYPPVGSTITWTASNVTPSSGTGATATFHSTCTLGAASIIIFTISNSCMSIGQTQVSKSYVSAGPIPTDVTLDAYKSTGQHARKSGGIFLLCPNSTYYLYVNNSGSCSTSQYSWTLPPSLTRNYTYNNMISVNTNSNPGGNILVYAQTCCSDCGSNVRILSDYVGKDSNCGYSFMNFTPNPATDETLLELKTDNPENVSIDDEWIAEIYNQQSLLICKTNTLKDNKYLINTSGWKEGIYYVRVTLNTNTLFGKFVVAR